MIRLVLVEDHAIVLRGLENLFSGDDRFKVVASCSNGEAALQAVRSLTADVMVLDLRMPDCSGLDVLRAIRREGLDIRVVVLTAAISDAEVVDILDLGALGLVFKESSPDELMNCIIRVHAGDRWIDRQAMGRALTRSRQRDDGVREVTSLLTRREIEIARLVAQGYRNRSIADRLAISEGTVKIHLHNVYEKVGIDGRAELMMWVRDKGL